MSEYYFTSDTHFFHDNIRRYCNRPFENVEEMNEVIIQNWNAVVKADDYIYHLGDFGFGPLQKLQEVFQRLNGRKYLIRGNHDNTSIKQLGWVWVKDTAMVKIHDQYVWLSHYPHRTWNRARHGALHLFGHIHNNLAEWGHSFNVGVDAWDFKPVHWDVVTQKMQGLGSIFVDLDPLDHHEIVQQRGTMMDEEEFIRTMILGIDEEEF